MLVPTGALADGSRRASRSLSAPPQEEEGLPALIGAAGMAGVCAGPDAGLSRSLRDNAHEWFDRACPECIEGLTTNGNTRSPSACRKGRARALNRLPDRL